MHTTGAKGAMCCWQVASTLFEYNSSKTMAPQKMLRHGSTILCACGHWLRIIFNTWLPSPHTLPVLLPVFNLKESVVVNFCNDYYLCYIHAE